MFFIMIDNSTDEYPDDPRSLECKESLADAQLAALAASELYQKVWIEDIHGNVIGEVIDSNQE